MILKSLRGQPLGRHQFRLRHLLIVVTWVAILLGLGRWASQHGGIERLPMWIGIGLVEGMASLLLGAGIVRVVRVLRARAWPRTEGIIAHYWTLPNSDEEGNRNDWHFPAVVFQDGAGRRVVVLSPMDADPKRWPRGTSVQVCFDPRNPRRAELVALLRPSLWRAAGAMIVGAAFGGLGVVFLLMEPLWHC